MGSAKPIIRLADAESDAPVATEETAPADLEAAFTRWARYVGAVGLRILGTRDDLEDLVQDVFVEAAAGLGTLRDARAAKAWLATVTVRLARRRLRRRRIVAFFVRSVPDCFDAADSAATPEQRVLLTQIYAFLETQPVDDRIAWTLRHIEGERLERVALLTGCSLATAKRRIRRVHDAIREVVQDG